jgi:DNA segregation ATPase FtsK/SpoIIIE, S-DNA-T family
VKQVTTNSLADQPSPTKHRLREVILIVLAAIATYAFIALATFHNSDPSWSNSGTSGFVANYGGKFGAWFSDIFLYLFGYLAYLFPVMLILAAWFMFYERDEGFTFYWRHAVLRLMGFILTLAAGCGLSHLYLYHLQGELPLYAGGVLGTVVSQSLINTFNFFGTSLILITLLLAGITLFTGLSWLALMDVIGKICLIFFAWTKKCFLNWRDSYRDRKNLAKTIEAAKEVEHKAENSFAHEETATVKVKKQVKQKKLAVPKIAANTTLPPLTLLDPPKKVMQKGYSTTDLDQLSREIEAKLLDFDIEARVVSFHPGPVITRFELDLAPGLKAAKVTALAKDLARSLSVSRVRVVEVIPGKSVIGLEIPNKYRNLVQLKELFEASQYIEAPSHISLALGKDISGYPVVVDLAKMPHLLVSGTTGSGKSISVNAMIFSILCKAQPEEVRFIMIDPKMLELGVYQGIPHLLTPVVTDMKEAANAFRWCVAEMDRRYSLMASLGVRDVTSFNDKVKRAIESGNPLKDPQIMPETQTAEEPKTLEPLPYIVLVVDELADMMMVVGKKVEELIARIAQKARAAGIHMILATQRPSVDVITGLIKANIPTRIAFQVSSKIDSRTILDQQGAEQLLGYGDMLYLPPGAGMPIRVHGPFVSEGEMHRLAQFWKQRGDPDYVEEVLHYTGGEDSGNGENSTNGNGDGEQDELYDQAVQIVIESRRPSISFVQRRLRIGYNRAANLIETMEKAGVVSPMEGNGTREVLVPAPREGD